jgi:hypothetical protein
MPIEFVRPGSDDWCETDVRSSMDDRNTFAVFLKNTHVPARVTTARSRKAAGAGFAKKLR